MRLLAVNTVCERFPLVYFLSFLLSSSFLFIPSFLFFSILFYSFLLSLLISSFLFFSLLIHITASNLIYAAKSNDLLFYGTLLLIFTVGVSDAIVQGSLYGLAGLLPPIYSNAVQNGYASRSRHDISCKFYLT
jgi:hypothetical protein